MLTPRAVLRRPILSLIAVIALVAGLITVPTLAGVLPSAQAAGTPDVQLSRTVAAQTLYGENVSVSLTASAPDSTPDVDGFNLTFSDVLPANAVVTGSNFPVTETITQLDGSKLLVWSNVADLLDGASVTLTYTFSYPVLGQTGARDVGDTFTGVAHAYVNTDPYMVPNPAVTPVDGSVWEDVSGSASATSTTQLVPYVVDVKELRSPEAELLRGIHDNKTVYQIKVTNNTVAPTADPDVIAYLPAGLEFLGCAAADNGVAPEYPGAPSLAASFPSLTGCNTQYTATTVDTDPDGGSKPMPSAVYTRVLWDQLADLAAGGSITMQYAAAIPLHANTVVPAVTDPVANLDNNLGAEANDEDALTTYVSVPGQYQGGKPAPVAFVVDDTDTVSAEDVRVVKSTDNGAINQTQGTTWTLDFATSEYTESTGEITVTDLIPDGLDWAGSSLAPTSGPTANADGTLTVVWTIPSMDTQDVYQITYQTTTRTDYRGTGQPVSANDSWTNIVDLTTSTDLRSGELGDSTRSVATVIDHSEAGQVAEDVKRDKLIAAPVGNDCTAVTVWHDDSVAPFHPGDTVCFRLDVDFPDSLDTMRSRISDYLPAGFTLVGNPYYNTPLHDLGDSTALSYTKNAAGTVLNWTKDEVDVGTYFSVILTTRIATTAITQTTDLVGNLLKVRYQNTATSTFQLRDQANAEITAPLLVLDKALVSPASGTTEAGQPIQYSIKVDNTGTQDATAVEVRDVLPTGWSCGEISSTSPSADSCTSAVLRWTGLTVPAGGSITLIVNGVAPTNGAPGDSYTNRAGVRSYQGASNSGPQTYYPASNIDSTVTTGMVNTSRADDSVVVSIGSATVAKVASSLSESGNNSTGQATIGEVVTFRVTTTIPTGSTLYVSPAITDPVNARYAIVGTPTYTVDTDGAGGAAPGAAIDATVTGGLNISIPLGPVDGGDAATYVNPAGSGADIIVLTYDARVLDLVSNKRVTNTQIPNTATLTWRNGATPTPAVRTATGSANISVVEPNLTLVKTSDHDAPAVPAGVIGTAPAGDIVIYTITVGNSGTRSSMAHEVDVTDTVPADLTPLKTGNAAANDGDTLIGGGVWHSTTRTITFPQITSIAVNATSVVSYRARVGNPVLVSGPIVNSVRAVTTSLTAAATGERDELSTNGDPGSGYDVTATNQLTGPNMTLTKAAAPGLRTIGQLVDYTLTVGIPAGVYGYDTTVLDTLPAGIRYHNTPITVTCLQGGGACSPAVGAEVIGTPTSSDTIVGFYLGDFTSATQVRTVTIQFQGVVTTTAALGTQNNSARVYSNDADTIGATPTTPPTAVSFTRPGASATAAVTVQRPVLTLDKSVNGVDATRAKPGQVLHYTVALTNTGSSAAYDVTITDTPDSDLTGYTAVSMPGVTAVDTDPSDGTLRWTYAGPLAPGATVTLAYDLTVPASFDETDEVVGAEIINIADAPSYFGVPSAQRTLASTYYLEYDDVVADQVDVEVDLASIGDRLWFDVDNDAVQDAGEPGLVGVDVSVRFAGTDGVLGTGDDEVATTTTVADGAYLVRNLPGGSYRVTADATDLPAGFTASYDLDGVSSANQWQGALAQNGTPRDVDFGYVGTGSIGDRVWFDQDADGVQDAGEPGIGGRTVTVVWAGFDGLLATAADNVTYATTTATNGSYSVTRLPAGSYSVTVSGMPVGFGSTKDPDAVADGTATTTLTAAQNRTDQDFGYAGTGSIGDLVWIDRDENGTYDTAGATPEQGVAGASVRLDWHGVTGTATDPVVATFATTTDTNGIYGFAHLVPGAYTVRVTGGLPATATNTHDRDGNKNSQTPIALTDGQSVIDADFGYSSDSSLGQRVWWDRNGNGAQDAGEPGFSDVDITVRWYGPNGVSGDGDDRIFTTVTGTDGYWSLAELPQGSYRVTVDTGDLPTGMAATFDADGVGTANTSVTTLGTGAVLTQNFGYRGAVSLGDLVFLDRDADGAQDAGEPGLAGVTVLLEWPTLGLTVAATTAADGTYAFPGLVADDYTVHVLTATLPSASLTAVSDLEGSETDASADVEMTTTSRGDADFGFRGASSIGDLVWNDVDADGVLDVEESGIAGVSVTARWAGRDAITGTGDDIVLSTVTDADGRYGFDALPQGAWTITPDLGSLPAGFGSATFEEDGVLDASDLVALGAAELHATADFGFRGTGTVGDRIWLDLDGDGDQDAGEPGIPGQSVTLVWAGRDGAFDGVGDETWITTTDDDGTWIVEDLPDGDFRVTVTGGITALADQTGDPDGDLDDETDVTLSAGDRDEDEADFGYQGDQSIGDTIWWDRSEDGDVDASEQLLEGVTVDLTWAGLDAVLGTSDDIVRTLDTDEDGQYLFEGLPEGGYRVAVTAGVPAGLEPVADPDATADGVSQLIMPNSLLSDADLDQDFGFAGSGSVGDRVWLDLNGDGIDDAGEPGIPGVVATLTWAGPDGDFATDDDLTWNETTSSTGSYLFEGLPAGDFRVALTGLPSGITATADPDGFGTADGSELTLDPGEADTAQDFGYVGTASLGDTVWVDLDLNAVQNGMEPGLQGIVVNVALAGADGALGTGDDIRFARTTGALGRYGVSGLPAGPVEVGYDTATLALGYLAASDRDGGSASDTVLALATGDAITDVDFAIMGDAKLHGFVFEDVDADGVHEKGERGRSGIVITVAWAGPAGLATFDAMTDTNGEWSFEKLPSGAYISEIDHTTVPSGYRVDTDSVVERSIVVGGTGYVVMGITNAALAFTGYDPRTNIAIGLLALLLGLGAVLAAWRRRPRTARHRA